MSLPSKYWLWLKKTISTRGGSGVNETFVIWDTGLRYLDLGDSTSADIIASMMNTWKLEPTSQIVDNRHKATSSIVVLWTSSAYEELACVCWLFDFELCYHHLFVVIVFIL